MAMDYVAAIGLNVKVIWAGPRHMYSRKKIMCCVKICRTARVD